MPRKPKKPKYPFPEFIEHVRTEFGDLTADASREVIILLIAMLNRGDTPADLRGLFNAALRKAIAYRAWENPNGQIP
jgi:hypothetical protein